MEVGRLLEISVHIILHLLRLIASDSSGRLLLTIPLRLESSLISVALNERLESLLSHGILTVLLA